MQLVYNNQVKIPNKKDLKNYDQNELIFYIQTLKSELKKYRKNTYWTRLK